MRDAEPSPDAGTHAALGPVLAVEDEALLAFDLEDMLREIGFADVTVCPSFERASAALDAGGFSHAVFDLNLGDCMSTPLVERATAMGIHVVVASGYEPSTVPLPDPTTVRLTKPYDRRQLARALGVRPPRRAAD